MRNYSSTENPEEWSLSQEDLFEVWTTRSTRWTSENPRPVLKVVDVAYSQNNVEQVLGDKPVARQGQIDTLNLLSFD